MSEGSNEVGSIGWMDLTVENAVAVRDFYQRVVGWGSEAVSMGDYEDFCMTTPDGDAVGGVCHARGANAEMPAQWLIYITVADLDASVERCREAGGEVLVGPRDYGGEGRYAVIRDPAGAASALFEPKSG